MTTDAEAAPPRFSFDERLGQLEAHVAEHGRLPPVRQSGLGRWLSLQRTRASAANQAILDTRVPGWRGTHSGRQKRVDAAFLARVAELEQTATVDGRLSTKGLPNALRQWVAYKRAVASSEQRAVLDDRVPGWNDQTRQATPEERVAQVRAFLAEHGRIPKQQDGTLGEWVRYQREITSPQTRHPLDEVAPGWRERASPKSSVDDRIAELLEVRQRTGAFPRFSDGTLGRWLADQRRRAIPENEAKLDAALPGWRESGRAPSRPADQSR